MSTTLAERSKEVTKTNQEKSQKVIDGTWSWSQRCIQDD